MFKKKLNSMIFPNKFQQYVLFKLMRFLAKNTISSTTYGVVVSLLYRLLQSTSPQILEHVVYEYFIV